MAFGQNPNCLLHPYSNGTPLSAFWHSRRFLNVGFPICRHAALSAFDDEAEGSFGISEKCVGPTYRTQLAPSGTGRHRIWQVGPGLGSFSPVGWVRKHRRVESHAVN